MRTDKTAPIIGIVGPCTAGKSTLIRNLTSYGIKPRHIAQEHSYVTTMWQRLTNPDVLIFLDVSFPVSLERKKLNWSEAEYLEQQQRLSHAREHTDLYIDTDRLSEAEVAETVVVFIRKHFPLLIAS
jgi:deoxyadenosine/deoxycytidine kinase